MKVRYVALLAVIAATAGCVEERVVHERRVVERPPVQREYVEVVAPQPPPVQVIEVEPGPRPGYVWARGYWGWEGGRYVPVRGHWEPVRPNGHYQHAKWVQRGDGWHWRAGGWVN